MFFSEKIKKPLIVLGYLFIGIFIVGVINFFFSSDNVNLSRNENEQRSFYAEDVMESVSPKMMSESSLVPMEQSFNTGAVQTNDAKVIKNGSLDLRVKETDGAATEIKDIARRNGGGVSYSNFFERVKGQKSGNITIKIPNENFDETLTELKAIATHVSSESVSSQDVTEQYADLETQIRNKKAEEESFLRILDRAVAIEDVLGITKELSRVRGEIERLEGRLKFLDNQVEMSTISISLTEDISVVASIGWRPWEVVKDSFRRLLANIQGFVDNTINFIVVVLPIAAIYGFGVWLLYLIGKRIYRKIRNK